MNCRRVIFSSMDPHCFIRMRRRSA
jgi:hypothetical protein